MKSFSLFGIVAALLLTPGLAQAQITKEEEKKLTDLATAQEAMAAIGGAWDQEQAKCIAQSDSLKAEIEAMKKAKLTLSKKEVDTCVNGCSELMKKEFGRDYQKERKKDFLRNSDNQPMNEDELQAEGKGSCKLAYQLYLKRELQNEAIESTLSQCPETAKAISLAKKEQTYKSNVDVCKAVKRKHLQEYEQTLSRLNQIYAEKKKLIDKTMKNVNQPSCPQPSPSSSPAQHR